MREGGGLITDMSMDIRRINELMAGNEWTAMLRELPDGPHTLQFPNIGAIKSCKAVAYDLNSDNMGRKYCFNVKKETLTVVITVTTEDAPIALAD